MKTGRYDIENSSYSAALRTRLGQTAPTCLYTLGEMSILHHWQLGLLCSIQCPGSIVIQTFDAVRALRDAGVVVVGGFHSPMERECLDILLRGLQPVIMCAAKRLRGLRLGTAARKALKDGRLLVISPFGDEVKRTTAAQASQRNELVAALADAVLVPYAAPGGKAESTAKNILARGQPLFTFADENNAHLFHAGAERCTPGVIASAATEPPLKKRLTRNSETQMKGPTHENLTHSNT